MAVLPQISWPLRLGAMNRPPPPERYPRRAEEDGISADGTAPSHFALQTPLFLLLFAGVGLLAALGFALHSSALVYVGLFATSLVAGTLLPFLPASSEMAMAGLLATDAGRPLAIILIAIVGTFLGASANYVVGRNIARLSGRRWFPLSRSSLERAREWFRRYGVWVLLMCWVPTAGDAMTVVAGLLRADLRLFLILTATGKTFGHLLVASGVTWIV